MIARLTDPAADLRLCQWRAGMTRRQTFALAALLAAPAVAAKQEETPMFDDLIKASMENKKGLTFYVKGQTIGGAVTKIGNGFVDVRSQQYSRVVIKLDSVDAVAMI
jgi:hypothetical protein